MSGFKSQAQRRKFKALLEAGDIDQKTFDEWESKSSKILPERAPRKFDDFKAPKVEPVEEKKASWKVQKAKPVAKVKKA